MVETAAPARLVDDGEWRSTMAAALRRGLTRNVIAPWFPRSIDRAHGGFTSGFNAHWRPIGPQHRLLEFQARQTRTAARLGVALPAEPSWHDITNHGLRYLDRVMRDRADGGWFELISRGGQPLLGGTKHAQGTAYVISACVEANRLTRQPLALAMAHEAFEWLETILHDNELGGYHGWATREGRPILGPRDLPHELAGRTDDHLGHEIGLKDASVHADLLESFTLLAMVSTDLRVKERLAELYDVLTRAFIKSDGGMHYLLSPHLVPVPGVERYGFGLQTGYRLEAAAQQLGRSVVDARALAQRLLDHAIKSGWDHRRGGFLDGASEGAQVGKRPWWVQTEAAKLLLLSASLDEPTRGRHHALFERLHEVIERDFIDRRRGGWEMLAKSDWPRRLRLTGRALPKSDIWKDASHEADMYLAEIRMLRGLAPAAPID